MVEEREFMGGRKAKMWTYLILLLVLVIGVLVVNFVVSNKDLAARGVDSFLGMPGWVFPLIVFVIGALIFWVGLKIETDWPEAIGALMISGSVFAGEVMVGWDTFKLGGLGVLPFLIPILTFVVLLMIGMSRSK
jgi:hypothetical protein